MRDIVFDPLHRDSLIPDPHIQRLLVFEQRRARKPEDRQAVVERDVYDWHIEVARECEEVGGIEMWIVA
jgi:hypothetical protein